MSGSVGERVVVAMASLWRDGRRSRLRRLRNYRRTTQRSALRWRGYRADVPNISLDPIDVRILEELQVDGRLSNVALADAVGLSPSPCLRRVKRLEEAGVIAGYQAVIDREQVGLDLTVFVEVSVERHGTGTQERMEERLLALPEVVACHVVSGQSDFLLEVVCRDLRDYDRFTREHLGRWPEVSRVYSNFAISTVKAGGPLPVRRSP